MFLRRQKFLTKTDNDCVIDLTTSALLVLENANKYELVVDNIFNTNDHSIVMGVFDSKKNANKALDYIYEQIAINSNICIVPEDNF